MSTPKQLAEKIAIECHQSHSLNIAVQKNSFSGYPPGHIYNHPSSWDAFLVCAHEVCEDSRTLIEHLKQEEFPTVCTCTDCVKEEPANVD